MFPHKPSHAPSRDAVYWSDRMNEYLIDSLLHEQAIGNRSESKFCSVAYDNIINGVGARFGVAIDRNNIKNRLKYIKESFYECKNLLGDETRIQWNAESKRFLAEPHVWRELVERKPEAKKWMMKTIDHYDRLMELFGKDREKRTAAENSKGASKKKARTELPKYSLRQTPPNGLGPNAVENSKQMVNEREVPDELVVRQGTSEELDLSELCRTETGIVPIPVPANAFGKGLPYAPENWPCPEDQWSWKVGTRASGKGHWADRYLTPPSRFRDATGKKTAFASRLQVEEFIKREFPDTDPSTFFSTFIWKIPAKGHRIQKGTQQVRLPEPEPEPVSIGPPGPCKARNNMCNLEREGFIESSPAQDCDICCKVPAFCRECCCIFCRRTVDYSFGGYSYIKCEAVVEESYICGHVAHLDCALRCFMAGTVGGTIIGLDVQYLCRRCDNKTNLMMHVERLMETCQSLKSRKEIKPILNLGLCILRGSKQTRAKSLEDYMGSAMAKLKSGVDIVEIWKMEDDEGRAAVSAGENSSPTSGVSVLGARQAPEDRLLGHPDPMDGLDDDGDDYDDGNDYLRTYEEKVPVMIIDEPSVMSAKFEDDIDLALKKLKESQETEFKLTEQKLYSQKDLVLSLYRQLESERSKLADPNPISDTSNYRVMLNNVVNCVDQVKREEEKFKNMLKVAGGSGKTPKRVRKELFGLSADK